MSAASIFLWATGLLFGLVYALPLLFAPLHWARAFGWRIPEDTMLTVYFGRCLGAVAVAIVVLCLRFAPHPTPLVLDLVALAGWILCAVHVWGAIRREQPWIETAEIALYAVAALAAMWIRP